MKWNVWRDFALALFMAPAQSTIAQNTIQIKIKNTYAFKLPVFSSAVRFGTDTVGGTLTLQSDGTWTGVVDASVDFWQEMKGLGTNCPMEHFIVTQKLAVVAITSPGFNTATSSITYRSGSANGGFLALEVKPVKAPSTPPRDCLDMHLYPDPIQPNGTLPLLPLNDGRWTNPPPYGYVIALPQRGALVYVDQNAVVCDPKLVDTTPCSLWEIRVERP